MMLVWTATLAMAQDDPTAAGSAPAGAAMRMDERLDIGAASLAVSPSGGHVLAYGERRAVLLAPDGSAAATVPMEDIRYGAVADNGTFVLGHDGGITVHSPESKRELLRLSAVGELRGLAISPDAGSVAIATSQSLTIHDTSNGRIRFSKEGETTAAVYGPDGVLWTERAAEVAGFDARGRSVSGSALPVPPGLLPDGCLGAPGAAEPDLCVGGTAWHQGDRLWALTADGAIERWHLLGASGLPTEGGDGAEIVSLASAGGDVLVARADGSLARRGPDGAEGAKVQIPSCDGGCAPSIGGGPAGFWALGTAGTFQSWDPSGAPQSKRPKVTGQLQGGLLADGRWVGLAEGGRIRIGKAIGKGKPIVPVEGATRVHVAGNTVAVWSATALQVLDSHGLLRSTPAIGADRAPAAVRLSPDGEHVAVIDDAGALHLYQSSGRPVFRLQAGLAGTTLLFDPSGETLLAGGSPLRVFQTADGSETARVWLSPPGALEHATISGSGELVAAQRTLDGQRLRRVAPTLLGRTRAPDAPAETSSEGAPEGGAPEGSPSEGTLSGGPKEGESGGSSGG